jgi:hypothetical protein
MAKILYVRFLIPPSFDAITIGPVILMQPHCKGDRALLEHELVHVRQWRRNLVLFWPRYLLSKKHRLRYEVEAYRRQLEFAPGNALCFARALSTRYWLNISVEEAYCLLVD